MYLPQLPADNKSVKPKDKEGTISEKLPERFSRQDTLDMSKILSIQERSTDRSIIIFCEKGVVFKEQHGLYTNLTLAEANKEE